MAKDPAFLFYPGDWLGGTMGMTFEEKGAYFELLMLQFNRGHMTEHTIRQTVGQIWDVLKVKFVQDESGLWYNERLRLEKEKRKTYVQSRFNNKEGKNQYPKKEGHMSNHMENRNENRNTSNNNGKKEKGIRIDEDSSVVYFLDGSFQPLGDFQKAQFKRGNISAKLIEKGVIE